uniref:Uncharacterized protein n=1 Tax=Physcomitrium patens TaxID=3218 RepID=A0A2K1L4D1_PHYPA|nr:hypothetical protein PHYPA_003675 [Physcomitrium patens]
MLLPLDLLITDNIKAYPVLLQSLQVVSPTKHYPWCENPSLWKPSPFVQHDQGRLNEHYRSSHISNFRSHNPGDNFLVRLLTRCHLSSIRIPSAHIIQLERRCLNFFFTRTLLVEYTQREKLWVLH